MRQLPLSVYALALICACGGNGDGGGGGADAAPPIEFDRGGLLENVGTNIVLPLYEQFTSEAGDLRAAVDAYCAALDSADEADRLTDARGAFHAVMDSWQMAEVMLLGPASAEGESIRDDVYSWPIVSACAVDQEVMSLREDPSGYDIAVELPNRRGLDALEYLLFQDELASACSTAPEGWSELSDADRRAARCAYAAAAAADLATLGQALVDAWHPDGGDFAGDLASAGEAGSSFATQADALNAVFAALFYLDTTSKDQKLGEPAGLVTNACGTQDEACPDELESAFADRGARNLEANLTGFELLFFGKGLDGEDRLGFDDYLVAAGAPGIADAIAAAVEGTRAALDALPAELREALVDSYATVAEVHAELREVTTPLKTSVPETLGLEIPTEAGGDAD